MSLVTGAARCCRLAAFRSRPLRRSQGRLTTLEASIPLRRKSRGRLTMLEASNLPPHHLPSQRRLHRLLLRSRRRRSSRIWRVAARRTAALHLQEAALVPSGGSGLSGGSGYGNTGYADLGGYGCSEDTVAVRTACSRRRNSSLDTVLRVHTGRVITVRGTPRWAAPPAALLDTEAAADAERLRRRDERRSGDNIAIAAAATGVSGRRQGAAGKL